MNKAVIKRIKRNGTSKKKEKTSQGEINLDIPRDRNASFEPIIVEKYNRDIYGIDVSAPMISQITDKIIPKAFEWQSRPLHTVYSNAVQRKRLHLPLKHDILK